MYLGPLAYKGVAAPTPPNQVILLRAPTTNDYINFNIGDRWIVPYQATGPSEQEWVLMSKAEGIAIWVQVNAGGAVTYTDHELLVGSGTSTINQIPHGTSGQALLSGGAGSDPSFGVVSVPAGGTDVSSFVAYTPICGGTTTTGALQSVASTGVSGQVLTSRGAGLLPVFEDPSSSTITVPQGGTGDTSIPAYQVVCGGVTDVDPLQTVGSTGSLNQVLTSQGAGALPIWTDNASGGGVVVTSYTTAGSGTHTLNADTAMVQLYMWGAGGNGTAGGSNPYFAGNPGSAGTFMEYAAPAVFFGGGGAAISYTVGGPATGVGNPSVFGGVITVLSSVGNGPPNSTGSRSSSNLTVNTGGSSGLQTFYNGASIAGGGGAGGDYTNSGATAGNNAIYGSGASTNLGGAAGTSGVAGGAGLDGTTIIGAMFGGGGGGGGYGANTGTASAGGAGGKPGGGGGAGGSVVNKGGAAGGAGAPGAIYVVEYLG